MESVGLQSLYENRTAPFTSLQKEHAATLVTARHSPEVSAVAISFKCNDYREIATSSASLTPRDDRKTVTAPQQKT